MRNTKKKHENKISISRQICDHQILFIVKASLIILNRDSKNKTGQIVKISSKM